MTNEGAEMFDLTNLMDYLPTSTTPEYEALRDRLSPYYEKLDALFTFEEHEDFWDRQTALNSQDCKECFLHGLRLGAQITVQLLCPPPPSRSPRP